MVWQTSTDGVQLNAQGGTGTSIEPRVDNIQRVYCKTADCIIVVEKETIFHRCVAELSTTFNKIIWVTGKGYPDVGTRQFLKFLTENEASSSLPVFGLMCVLSIFREEKALLSGKKALAILCGAAGAPGVLRCVFPRVLEKRGTVFEQESPPFLEVLLLASGGVAGNFNATTLISHCQSCRCCTPLPR